MTIAEIKAQFPFPWAHSAYANGSIRIVDAAGKEVPLFTLLDFVNQVTTLMNKPKADTP